MVQTQQPETLSELQTLRKEVTQIQSQLNKKTTKDMNILGTVLKTLGIIVTSVITTLVTLVLAPDIPIVQQNVITPINKWNDQRWIKYKGSKYRLSKKEGTWAKIQEEAKEDGGNLVTINDAEEQWWLIETYGMRTFNAKKEFWIGLTDQEKENEFKWISGEISPYRAWALGEPNDTFYDTKQAEDFVVMNRYIEPKDQKERDVNVVGQWNDFPGDWPRQGIIEVKTED
ncbi:MAG: lectin-like protein [Snowella sp.]